MVVYVPGRSVYATQTLSIVPDGKVRMGLLSIGPSFHRIPSGRFSEFLLYDVKKRDYIQEVALVPTQSLVPYDASATLRS